MPRSIISKYEQCKHREENNDISSNNAEKMEGMKRVCRGIRKYKNLKFVIYCEPMILIKIMEMAITR
jgi:hypothetical protein